MFSWWIHFILLEKKKDCFETSNNITTFPPFQFWRSSYKRKTTTIMHLLRYTNMFYNCFCLYFVLCSFGCLIWLWEKQIEWISNEWWLMNSWKDFSYNKRLEIWFGVLNSIWRGEYLKESSDFTRTLHPELIHSLISLNVSRYRELTKDYKKWHDHCVLKNGYY